jgi:hypothetical protein
MSLRNEFANEEQLFREISQLGIMTAQMMIDAEEDRSMTIPMFGKIWRVMVEEQGVTNRRRGRKTHAQK